MNTHKIVWAVVASLAMFTVVSLAQVPPPGRINYQGVLRDAAGNPLSGLQAMTFRLYDAPVSGTVLWEETYSATNPPQVPVTGGLFTVALGDPAHKTAGSEVSFQDVFAMHGAVHLAVAVGLDAEMTPRIQVVSAPFSVNAARLEGRGAPSFANAAHAHPGGDITSAVAEATHAATADSATNATNADTVDGQHAAYFLNTSSTAQTKSGKLVLNNAGAYGIDSAGATAGGYFHTNTASGVAYVGYDDYGIAASGDYMGGYFESSASGAARVAYGDYGVEAAGNNAGGFFYGSASGSAKVGTGHFGINAEGNTCGGYFKDADNSGYAYAGFGDFGIDARGDWGGGYFVDLNDGSWAGVAYGTTKISGSGTVNFVQNHPEQKDKVIVYACPEGDEVAVYTRGTAKLVNGEARVMLGETFKWVTNPDLGLTANLTPHGEAVPLAVVSLSTTELIVRGPRGGPADLVFDYIVYGLRIGFEESSIVQEKQRESYIPSFTEHRQRYAKYPELRAFSALERFKTMESSVRGVEPSSIDLSRAHALKEAIHEYDPAADPPVYELFGHGPGPLPQESTHAAHPGERAPQKAFPTLMAVPHQNETVHAPTSADAANAPAAAAAPPLLSAERFPVSTSVSVGDVLVMIANDGDTLYPCARAADSMVVGIALDATKEGTAPVATFGCVLVKVDASQAPIAKGDLLVTSPFPGYAMKAQPTLVNGSPMYRDGTLIGKALEPLQSGLGVIKVLVMVR